MPVSVLLAPGTAGASGGSITGLTVHPGPSATGWKNATYAVTFTATDGISSANTDDGSAIVITMNDGSTFGNGNSLAVTDNTNPVDSVVAGDVCGNPNNNQTVGGILGNCPFTNNPINIPAGDSVTITFNGVINPSTPTNETLTVSTNNDPNPATSVPFNIEPEGYWLVGFDGGVFTFGNANFYGSTGSLVLQRPVVGIVTTANHGGYWLDASDGGVFSFGNTQFYGSIPGLGLHPAGSGLPHSLNAPIVGMVPSFDDQGYFMVASDGGVFAFGDAKFAGSCPGIGGCAGAAVAVLPDASGNGYWLVTSLGDVYGFGDAPYLGAPGNQGWPVTSAVRTPDGGGYWVLSANATISNYGDAVNLGTPTDNGTFSNPATAIFGASDSQGASVVFKNGLVDSYGDAPNYGGMQGTNLNGSIIAASGF